MTFKQIQTSDPEPTPGTDDDDNDDSDDSGSSGGASSGSSSGSGTASVPKTGVQDKGESKEFVKADGTTAKSEWVKQGDDWYYFNENAPQQNWFKVGNDWVYDGIGERPLGSMYRGEMTPDGYYVDKTGAWTGEPVQK